MGDPSYRWIEECLYAPSYCYDCNARIPAAAINYARRGFALQALCTECYVESGDDNFAAHAAHCRECNHG